MGGTVPLSIPELSLRGPAKILHLSACPPIADGDGAVVIGRFISQGRLDLVDVTLAPFDADGAPETVRGTASHPIWHETVADWVGLGDLQPGDLVRGRDGLLTVESVELVSEPQRVYNLEIHGEHVYEVTRLGLLTHNTNWCDLTKRWGDLDAKKRSGQLTPDELDELNRLEGEILSNVTDANTYTRPSGFRAGVRNKVWDDAIEGSTGRVRDPVTGRFIGKDQPWDMGHKPGFEFRKHQESAAKRGIDRKQFLDEHNDASHFRPELPSSNRGHSGEDLTNNYLGP